MPTEPFLRRARIRNYKSIAACDVELGRFTILVGRNGSGKSNFLDALLFLGDALQTSLAHAVDKRGRMRRLVPRFAQDASAEVEFVLTFALGNHAHADYLLVFVDEGGQPVRRREQLLVRSGEETQRTIFESRGDDIVSEAIDLKSLRVPAQNLMLPLFSGIDPAGPVFDWLRRFKVYDPQPQRMKRSIFLDGQDLKPDGSNAASVLYRLQEVSEDSAARLNDFLSVTVDGLDLVGVRGRTARSVKHEGEDAAETFLAFHFDREGRKENFAGVEVSDGTRRALAILLAAMQRSSNGRRPPAMGIEEPEVGLHPAASGALMEALREASLSTQILMTTHSPDLLDRLDLDNDRLVAVENGRDGTRIGPPDEVGLSAMKDHLYTAGDLLRMNRLEPAETRDERTPAHPSTGA